MYAVGVGDTEMSQLTTMASSEDNVLHVKDYDSIKLIQSSLVRRVCQKVETSTYALPYMFFYTLHKIERKIITLILYQRVARTLRTLWCWLTDQIPSDIKIGKSSNRSWETLPKGCIAFNIILENYSVWIQVELLILEYMSGKKYSTYISLFTVYKDQYYKSDSNRNKISFIHHLKI